MSTSSRCLQQRPTILADEYLACLRAMHEWWSPQAPPASPRQSAESFTDDELRGSFRFGRDTIGELIELLGVPHAMRSASTMRFDGEEAFLLSLRRLGGCERNFRLAQVVGRSSPTISKMYDVVLYHALRHAMPAMCLEISEEHFPSFANVLHAYGCREGHYFGFIDGTMFTMWRPTYNQEAIYNG